MNDDSNPRRPLGFETAATPARPGSQEGPREDTRPDSTMVEGFPGAIPGKPNPDPRIEEYIKMVVAAGVLVRLSPHQLIIHSNNGAIIIGIGDSGVFQVYYDPPFRGEPGLNLYEGDQTDYQQVRMIRAVTGTAPGAQFIQ